MNTQSYLKNVTTVKLDSEKCTGCKICTLVCPHGVFEMNDKKAFITNADKCMECGACAKNCAWNAITVRYGVGCAYGIMNGILKGTEATCGCGEGGGCC
jgi:NAD-dependent dihydropyrimidine dehydrogenase PreA subunit